MIQTVPARAPGPPLLLTLYVAALLALFATHLDLYLHETRQLGVNTIYLFVACCLPFLATLVIGPNPDRLLARCLEALNASAVPLLFFVMWMAGHVLLMGGTVLPEQVDFTLYFPLFQLTVLLFGLCIACTPGFAAASRPAGSLALLVLAGTVLYDAFHPGSFSRGAGTGCRPRDERERRRLRHPPAARPDDPLRRGAPMGRGADRHRRSLRLLHVLPRRHPPRRRPAGRLRRLPRGESGTRAAARLTVPALGLLVAAAAAAWLLQSTAIVHLPGSIDRLSWFESGSTADNQESRVELLHHYWGLIEQHPILGYGTGAMEAAAALAPSGQGPHNQYLRVWMDHGLWGLTAYVGLLLSALALFVARRSWSGSTLVAITLANGVFSHNITEDKTFLLLLGAALAASALDPGPAGEVDR